MITPHHSNLLGKNIIKKSFSNISMDITIYGFIRIVAGLAILAYVGYCMINQKVWIRGEIGFTSKTFAWGSREENPKIFIIHTIIGTIFGIYMIASPFMW